MTKELVLENYGVMEMDESEKIELDGGFILAFITYTELSKVWKDVMQGYEHCKKKLDNQ